MIERVPIHVCPHCGIFLYADHNCLSDKCLSWNCPKRSDQFIYHHFEYGYPIKKTKEGLLDESKKYKFCDATTFSFCKTNYKTFCERKDTIVIEKKGRKKKEKIIEELCSEEEDEDEEEIYSEEEEELEEELDIQVSSDEEEDEEEIELILTKL